MGGIVGCGGGAFSIKDGKDGKEARSPPSAQTFWGSLPSRDGPVRLPLLLPPGFSPLAPVRCRLEAAFENQARPSLLRLYRSRGYRNPAEYYPGSIADATMEKKSIIISRRAMIRYSSCFLATASTFALFGAGLIPWMKERVEIVSFSFSARGLSKVKRIRLGSLPLDRFASFLIYRYFSRLLFS